MTPEQLDLVEQNIADVVQQVGYCKVDVLLDCNPLPLTGFYERFDKSTIVIHNGNIGRWVIDIQGIVAIGVTT